MSVVLHEDAALVDAVGAGRRRGSRRRPPASARRRSSSSRSRASRAPRSAATQHMTFDDVKCCGSPRTSQMPRSGSRQCSMRRLDRACEDRPQPLVAAWSRERRVDVDRVEHRAPDVVLALVEGAVADRAPGGRPRSRGGGRASAPSARFSPSTPYMICRSSRSRSATSAMKQKKSFASQSKPSVYERPERQASSRGSRCSGSPSCARRRASRAATSSAAASSAPVGREREPLEGERAALEVARATGGRGSCPRASQCCQWCAVQTSRSYASSRSCGRLVLAPRQRDEARRRPP